MTLTEARNALRHFTTDRDWHQFHTPKNLAMALASEAGELVALYRWLQPDEAAPKERVGEELADVLIFAIRMADVCGIDLLAEVARKIEQNAERYPVEFAHGNARKYTEFDDDQHGTQRR